jgi:hypothetical protein
MPSLGDARQPVGIVIDVGDLRLAHDLQRRAPPGIVIRVVDGAFGVVSWVIRTSRSNVRLIVPAVESMNDVARSPTSYVVAIVLA